MKRPKKKTGGNGDAAQRWNNELLADQASFVNTPRTNATKSEKIKATLKAKAERFKSQTIKVNENWSIVRADELNWQIRHKDQRAPYHKWYFGTLRGALLALPDKMLGEEARGTIDDVRRCYRGFCEAVLNALPEGSFELIKTVAKGGAASRICWRKEASNMEAANPDAFEKEFAETDPNGRIAKLTPPVQPVNFGQWRGVIDANFPRLLRPAEICLSVVTQLLLNDVSNPFALALVDVPSSGKTIILNFFDGPAELSYTTDNFTPASFVSHASNRRREDLGKVDLLPRIRYHVLIVRELGSIFGAKDDDLIKSLGILTRVLDGEGLETDSGVHGRRGYKGDYLFMFLAGTPPIPPRVFKIMGNFGSRLFFLRLHALDEDDAELIAQNKGTAWKLKQSECRRATENFLRRLWVTNPDGVMWNKADDPDDCLLVIARCARLLARLRGAINVWHSDGEGGEKLSHTVPVIEKPNRINCLLYNLARAHALICGRRQLTADDLWPVLDVTLDSAPTNRSKVIRGLIEAGGSLCTSDVVRLLGHSAPTALKEMEALSLLAIVDKTLEDQDEPGRPETQITLASRFAWFETEDCKILMGGMTPTQGGNLFKIQPQGIKKEFPPSVTVKDASELEETLLI